MFTLITIGSFLIGLLAGMVLQKDTDNKRTYKKK